MSKKPAAKKLLIALVAIFIVGASGYIYYRYRELHDLEPLLITKLQKIVKEGTKGLYNLKLDKLDIDPIKSRIILVNIRLEADSMVLNQMIQQQKAPNDIYSIYIKTLAIDDLSGWNLIKNKKFISNILFIRNPEIKISHTDRNYNTKKENDSTTFYQHIAKEVGKLQINKIVVNDMNFTYYNFSKQKKASIFKNVSMTFSNVLIDSTTQYDSTRFLYAKKANVSLRNYQNRTADSLYFINIDSIGISAQDHSMAIENFSLKPRLNKNDFEKKLSFITDRYDINIHAVFLKKIDWWSLVTDDGFAADEVGIDSGKFKDYCDRSLPLPPSKLGKYPQQLLVNLTFPFRLIQTKISNFYISYEEYNPKTQKSGTIFFTDVSGMINNASNIPEEIKKNSTMKVSADAKFMNSAPIHADFYFDLTQAKQGNFLAEAALGSFNETIINPVLKPLALVEINKINVKQLKAHIEGNNYSAHGSVTLLYDNLDVNALEKDPLSSKKTKKRKFLSFIANTFILESSNPSKNSGTPRTATPSYKRDIHKSFFNLIFKIILEGILTTIGYPL